MTGVTVSCFPSAPPPRALSLPGGFSTPSWALFLASCGHTPPRCSLGVSLPTDPSLGHKPVPLGLRTPPCPLRCGQPLTHISPPGPVAFLACLGLAAGLALLIYCCPPGGCCLARPPPSPHESPGQGSHTAHSALRKAPAPVSWKLAVLTCSGTVAGLRRNREWGAQWWVLIPTPGIR